MPLTRTEKSVEIPLAQIDFSDQKWRAETADTGLEELAKSLKEQGQIHNVSLLRDGGDKYEVINGHRRISAAKIAKMRKIRADLYDWDARDGEDRELAIAKHLYAANLSEPLTLLEKARMFEDIRITTGFGLEQLAGLFEDETVDTVNDALQLLSISDDALEIVERNPDRFTEAHLRVLADHAAASKRAWRMKPEEQVKVAREIVEQKDKTAVRDSRKFETRIKSVVNERRRDEQQKKKEQKKKERRQSDPVKELFKALERTENSVSELVDFEVADIKQIDPVDKGHVLKAAYTLVEQLGDFAEDSLSKLPQRKGKGS
jgi:ParB family chromosome partitioning protein